MLKFVTLAATAALLAAPAFAQAVVPVEVELEGILDNFDSSTRTLTVMGMQVEIPTTAVLHSPTATRAETGLPLLNWFRGAAFPGRTRVGFTGGTAIVIGEWNPATNKIVASDVFAEPTENVALGVITAASCSNANCDGATDYIRGNSKVGGAPGPAMLPVRDIRMPAGPIHDETGFRLNLTNASLNGLAYAAEGYYGSAPVTVQTGTPGSTVSELAFHYFLLDLVEPSPQFFANKNIREISMLRADCREGERFELRGNVHSIVNANGTINDSVLPNSGVAEIVYPQGGQVIRRNAAITRLDATSPVGTFRIRFDVPGVCPPSVTLRWVTAPNLTNPNTAQLHARITDVPVENRDDGAGDD